MVSLQYLFCLVVLVGCAAAQMYYGSQEDKRNFDREFMHFGKRGLGAPASPYYDKRTNDFDRNFMHFGKRLAYEYEPMMEKKEFNREFMHFGKRSGFSDGSFFTYTYLKDEPHLINMRNHI
ncbi:hypothetical protein FO519_002957 [Halicephalobus sp. NKZ332]|nr:hypothetical protein FO519_002957 [Halicephalobus sp. NKZ332]